MDTLFQNFPDSLNGYKFDHHSIQFHLNQNPFNGFKPNHTLMDPDRPSDQFSLPTNSDPPASNSASPSSTSSDETSPDNGENGDIPNTVLKYISEMLMEEDLEGKPCMLQDCLALQAAEKSLYDALGQKYPSSTVPCLNQNLTNPDETFTQTSSLDSNNSYSTANKFVDSIWDFDQSDFGSSLIHQPSLIDPPGITPVMIDLYSEIMSSAQFGGVMGEAENFFPIGDTPPSELSKGSRGKKTYHRQRSDRLEEGRSSKHSAVSPEEPEQSSLFDEVLLCKAETENVNNETGSCSINETSQNGSSEKLQLNGQSKGSNGGSSRGRKKGKKKEVVDLSTLLTQCAQAVASNDQRTANGLLKQIRQHSSSFGDGAQRMAYYFADGLEARLAGNGTPMLTPIVNHRTSAAEILKAYQVYVRACPFKRMSYFFANRTILKLAEKATRLHIVDFGICYGFQWPCFIQRLSNLPGGPRKVRITGIELPQPGFRPAERVEETGRRLQRYCERFNVPFEYVAIAQKWETIKLEDLKIDRDEVTIVNCMYRLRNLPDDTVVVNSARDAVLNLIKKINPDLFMHGVVNGTYNAPFFLTRFREALFHFSALFDMFEENVPREDEERRMFEREVFGREAMNVIACEGTERIERPETHKQWQVRNLRAGLRQLPLNGEILKKVRSIVKSEYHKDFVIDVDGHWMLQGWKGRVIYALSCWKPVQD